MLLFAVLVGCQTTEEPADDTADTTPVDTAPRALASGEHIIEHDGLSRTFRLHLPDDLPLGAPLVVAFHGYSGSADGIQGYAGLDVLADAEGFAVVYPQSLIDTWGYGCWNVGYCDYAEGEVDDVGFARAVIEAVVADQGLDGVLITGMSNGGDMTYRMACEASDLVDVTAPIAGCLMAWLADACAPAEPPPMLHIHGNADGITLWDGDPSYTGGGYYGTLDSIGFIAGLHGATDYTTETVTAGNTTTIDHRWSASDGVAAQLIEIDGGGHVWPSGDVDATAQLWAFFTAHR